MKKLYTLLSLLFVGTALMAQVTVTYKVDITGYLAEGNVLGAGGMRVGGNFLFIENSSNLIDWTPSDANSALTQEGSTNVWAISVVYPASSIGKTQEFKFVNNDWGTNEGTATSEIASGGCGIADLNGNINRTLVIPATNVGYLFCYEKCTRCDGSPALITSSISDISSDKVEVGNAPNPFSDKTTITYSVAGSSKIVNLSVYDMTGRKINTLVNESKAPGVYTTDFVATDAMSNGIYFYTLTSGTDVVSGKMSINR